MKTLAFVVCLAALPLTAQGRSAADKSFKTTGTFFAVSVADMESSVRWYRDTFALEILMQVPKQNGVAVTVLEGGGMIVELIQDDAARPPGYYGIADTRFLQGLFKAGLLVKDFDRTVEQLRAKGVTIAFGPFPANGNQKANVVIRDNSGNLLQIIGE